MTVDVTGRRCPGTVGVRYALNTLSGCGVADGPIGTVRIDGARALSDTFAIPALEKSIGALATATDRVVIWIRKNWRFHIADKVSGGAAGVRYEIDLCVAVRVDRSLANVWNLFG